VESKVVRSFDRDLVVHLADPAIYLSLYGHLCNLGIQYKEGKSTQSSLIHYPKDEITDLESISSLESDVAVYVGLPVLLLMPSSLTKPSI